MKKTLLFSLLLLAATFCANAEHYKGGQIFVAWGTPSTYSILVQTFLPCTGPAVPVPDSIYVCYFNSCNTTAGTLILHLDQSLSPSPPQVRTYNYIADFPLPSTCDKWTFYTSIAGRDSAVNVNSTGANIYLEATLNNTVSHPSATFIEWGSYNPVIKAGVPYSFITDGIIDSVVFETIMPRTAPANYLNPGLCQGSYAATDLDFTDTMYNLANNPIAANNSYTLSQQNDTMIRQFTPTAAGYGKNILVTKASRYKNGVFIASSMVDEEFILVPETVHAFDYLDTNSITGGHLDGDTIQLEVGTNLEFCVHVTSDYSAMDIMDNHGVALPASSVSYSTSNDTTKACYTWTPLSTDTGLHNLVLTGYYHPDSMLCGGYYQAVAGGQLTVPLNVHPRSLTTPTPVNNLSNNNAVKVFPNPAQHTVYVQAPVAVQVTLMGLDGRILQQVKNAGSIDISNLPDGIYLLRIADLNGQFIKMEKLIKTASE